MANYLKAGDIISGKRGLITATVDGKVRTCAEVKSVTATISKNKTSYNTLGKHGEQHKATGWSGSGDMTIYHVTSFWDDIIMKYVEKGVDTNFSLLIENDDPNSDAGVKRTTLMDVNLDSIEIAKLDVDADGLDSSVSFTFEDVAQIRRFSDPF